MDRAQVEEQAKDLVGLAEDGDKFALSLQLNRMDPLERIAVAQEIDRLNEQRRLTNTDLPDVVLDIKPSDFPGGPGQLNDIKVKEEASISNLWGWFSDLEKDVYDPSDNG